MPLPVERVDLNALVRAPLGKTYLRPRATAENHVFAADKVLVLTQSYWGPSAYLIGGE